MTQITIYIDEPPPSVNQAWRHWKGRVVRSAEFQAWETSAWWQVKQQAGKFKIPDPAYWGTMLFVHRSKTRIDVDNVAKACHDMLRKTGIVPDDRYLVSTSQFYYTGDKFRVDISWEPLETWIPIMNPSDALKKRLMEAENGLPKKPRS